jgi:hypothetical protein
MFRDYLRSKELKSKECSISLKDLNLLGISLNLEILGIPVFLGDHYWDPKVIRMLRYWDSNSPGTLIFLGDYYWEP